MGWLIRLGSQGLAVSKRVAEPVSDNLQFTEPASDSFPSLYKFCKHSLRFDEHLRRIHVEFTAHIGTGVVQEIVQ